MKAVVQKITEAVGPTKWSNGAAMAKSMDTRTSVTSMEKPLTIDWKVQEK